MMKFLALLIAFLISPTVVFGAIAVESVSTRNWAVSDGSQNVTLDAPSGTGGLLIAILANEQARTVTSVPSGWTLGDSIVADSTYSETTVYVYYKTATGGDSYTWQVSSAAGQWSGAVIRVSGSNATGFIDANSASVDADATPSFANGVTPTEAESLLVFASTVRRPDATLSGTGYAIANNNPTWTERAEIFSASLDAMLVVATAVRTETTATGNSSFTVTNGDATTDSSAILTAFAPVTAVVASVDQTYSQVTWWR